MLSTQTLDALYFALERGRDLFSIRAIGLCIFWHFLPQSVGSVDHHRKPPVSLFTVAALIQPTVSTSLRSDEPDPLRVGSLKIRRLLALHFLAEHQCPLSCCYQLQCPQTVAMDLFNNNPQYSDRELLSQRPIREYN